MLVWREGVCVREKESERERNSVCVYMRKCVCVCVCVLERARERGVRGAWKVDGWLIFFTGGSPDVPGPCLLFYASVDSWLLTLIVTCFILC